MEPDLRGIFPVLFIRELVVMLTWGCVCDRLLGAPHLFQSPVELCRPEGVQLNEVSPQQKHQTAVVHVQGVMMPVHLCKKKNTEKAYCICNVNEDTQEITYTGCQSWNLTLSKDLHL